MGFIKSSNLRDVIYGRPSNQFQILIQNVHPCQRVLRFVIESRCPRPLHGSTGRASIATRSQLLSVVTLAAADDTRKTLQAAEISSSNNNNTNNSSNNRGATGNSRASSFTPTEDITGPMQRIAMCKS